MNLSDLIASFASAFTQDSRVLELHFGSGGPLPGTLLPHVLEGSHQLSNGYVYTLQCLSSDTSLELKTLLGLAVEVDILSADGGQQVITGVVSAAAAKGSDGGFARYDLTIEPPFSLLRLRTASRVFQDLSVPDIVKTVLDEHVSNNPVFGAHFATRFDLSKTYPSRSYTVQYRESDLDFLHRILAEEGIPYRYEFEGGDTPLTTLVPFDDPYQLEQSPLGRVRFHRADVTESEDALTHWSAQRQITPAQVSLASFDYKPAGTTTAADETRVDQGEAGRQLQSTLTHYDAPGAYYGSDGEDLGRYAGLRQQAIDALAKHFIGEGTVRGLDVGQWFQLDNHPGHEFDTPEDRQFTVTSTIIKASNNLPGDLQQGLSGLIKTAGKVGQLSNMVASARTGDAASIAGLAGMALGSGHSASDATQDAPFKMQMQTQRRGLPLLPDYAGKALRKPTAPGLQTALVVGPAGEEIHTDDQGRIKIQLHWQRSDEHPQSGANLDDNSSCWVRVAMPAAGDGWGNQHIPRIGQEVVVQFIEGDIDRPLVTGVLYNGSHRPPAFSGAGSLPNNKVLSGFKSKEYKGSQYNELLFDDSTGEVRAKLSSEHGKTQLNLGYLTHPRTDGKAEARGEGFELRTDKHGAIRAGAGVFISADAASNAAGKQLDRSTAQSSLDAAFALAQSLGETATHQLADTPETGNNGQAVTSDNAAGAKQASGHQYHLKEALRAWENGSNTAKDASGDQAGMQGLLVLSAPAGIALATSQSQTLAAGTNLDITAQRDTNQTSGRRWLHNVGEHISLFVAGVADKVAMKLISAKGKIQIQAQADSIEMQSAKNIEQTAHETINITAGKEILLTAGGAYIRLAGGNIEIHAPGAIDIKGASHSMSGPAQMQKNLPEFKSPYAGHFQMVDEAGNVMANHPYLIEMPNGNKIFGVTDNEGKTVTAHTPQPDKIAMTPVFADVWDDEQLNLYHTEMRELWDQD
ncbi:type VI secretion system Vgr family protein [Amantichitinum ursilacus]|uniref:Phage-related baseplate assembly protein n=1 Tax=Amantichitinum ursilacus TaxID=857265 RepID=A0A0N0XIS0_9NEIS|nr:type VI secretion system Vgr family protein [Amantichitinum ursilacus]KPC50389.1 Phage-related baseplate assembly protein [Amantichitinum ursilacus]